MRRPNLIARAAVVAAMAAAALVLPTGALAAPTASNITSPTDPSFVTVNVNNPGSLHVTGTTSGGTGDVDLRCYFSNTSVLVEAGVSVSSNSFSTNVQMNSQLYDSFNTPRPYCVLRAVPTGSTPAAAPDQPSPFQGPHLGWGSTKSMMLGPAGNPNPGSLISNYFADRAQPGAYNDYYSAGNCGLCETYLFTPGTFGSSQVIWYGNAALYRLVNGDSPTRSSLQVDGVDAYAPGAIVNPNELVNNPGFPSVDWTAVSDPITGDLTIDESDQIATCTPQPAAYPPTDATCPGFAAPVLTLHRHIVQNHQGHQVTITDHWKSDDGKAHQLDAVYDETNKDYTAVVAGHHSLYDFAWTGAGFTTYPDHTQITPPASGPATLYVKTDATTPDGGDGLHAFGALTYGTQPSEMKMQHGANATNTVGDWNGRYLRTVPATGDLVITQVYSHDFSLASVQAMAHEAEQALPPWSAPASDPGPAGTTSQTPAGSTTTTAATTPVVVKCKVPKLRGRTLRSAKRLLLRSHCRLGKVTRKATTRVRSRRVLKSKPRAGSVRTRGARIAVVLAKRP
jgi:hypothetical protein